MAKIRRVEIGESAWKDVRGWVLNPLPLAGREGRTLGNLHVASMQPGAVRGNHTHGRSRSGSCSVGARLCSLRERKGIRKRRKSSLTAGGRSFSKSRQAGTMHLGASLEEIGASIRDAHQGRKCRAPYVVLAQPSLFDPTRAPAGGHTPWAYCHAPHGSAEDMTNVIGERIEQHAPGFRGLILAKSSMPPAAMERCNPNYGGGDINGGVHGLCGYTRPGASDRAVPPRRASRPLFH